MKKTFGRHHLPGNANQHLKGLYKNLTPAMFETRKNEWLGTVFFIINTTLCSGDRSFDQKRISL